MPDDRANILVQFHRDVPLESARAIVERHGGAVNSEVRTLNALVITIPRANIEPLAAEDAVLPSGKTGPAGSILPTARTADQPDSPHRWNASTGDPQDRPLEAPALLRARLERPPLGSVGKPPGVPVAACLPLQTARSKGGQAAQGTHPPS